MIVVTGSDGIIGRALCKKMQTQSIRFLPITHHRKPYTFTDALLVDLASALLPLEPYIHDIKAIVHLAAAVPHSTAYPDNDISANKTRSMDCNIIELQKLTNAHVVYMSTCGLYDRTSTAIKNELDCIEVTTPYFAAKARGEALFTLSGNTTILRLSAPVGYGLKSNLVLSKFIATTRNNRPIAIWGSGKREQNFIDADDVSDLVIKALRLPCYDIFNVASESPTTMLTLAETVRRVLDKGSIEMVSKKDPLEGETARYSINKAKKTYGWSPKITLEQSIKKIAFEDFANNL